MCEANVYISCQGHEELLMKGVDRIVPGEGHNIFMENIFGERRVIKARIKEMELVHNRIILEEVQNATSNQHDEIWLEPDTNHGHFHAGETVRLKLHKGYNMHADTWVGYSALRAFLVNDGVTEEVDIDEKNGTKEICLNRKIDSLVQVYALEQGDQERYAITWIEVGHHHHHGTKPAGLPLEIVPCEYSHARMGEKYSIQVLKDGKSLAGTEVRVTYNSAKNRDYPHRLTTDEEGRVNLFLTARGNYLFSVSNENTICTFTLIKNY